MKLRVIAVLPLFVFLAAFPFSCDTAKDAGVFKSQDAGVSWQQKITISEKEDIGRVDILTITIDPQDSQKIYLGTRGSSLYRSIDGGETWVGASDSNGNLDKRAIIHDIAIDANDTNAIYLAAYQGNRGRFFRSQDGGSSWQETYVVANAQYAVYSVAIDPKDSAVVYMGTAQGGFLKSADYGQSWELIRWFDDIVSDIAIDPSNNNTIYISTFNKGIHKTTDKGLNWQSFEKELKEFKSAQKVDVLLIDQQNPNIIYTGSEYGLLRSTDGGQSWVQVDIVIPPKSVPILAVAVNPQNSDEVYYGAGSIIYRSQDRGENWTVKSLPSGKSIKAITLDLKEPNVVYIGMSNEK